MTTSHIFQSTLPHGERHSGYKSHWLQVKISIHAPAWGATSSMMVMKSAQSLFQSTLPHGERLFLRHNGRRRLNFNPRSRMGSDAVSQVLLMIGSLFQSTLPHGERLNTSLFVCACILFQSTLPHGERPVHRGINMVPNVISIHAPAWGATFAGSRRSGYCHISIHAPAWGATPLLAPPRSEQ